jgi:Ca-activated chloride channel homolog
MRRAVAVTAGMLAAALTLVSAQFRASVDAVRVDVLVTENGRPVTGLKVQDFELRDSGVVQAIHAAVVEDVPLRVMLALDTSGSVDGAPLQHLRQAASAAVTLLAPADHAALITFAGVVALECPWTGDRERIQAAIRRTSAGGSTTLYDATYAALTLRDPEPGRTLVLVFSDGADRASWLSGERVLDAARRSEAVVYAATLPVRGNPVYGYRLDFHTGLQAPVKPGQSTPTLMETFLGAVTDETGGKVVDAQASDELADVFAAILHEFRSRYLLMYTPRGVEAGGWHPLEVRLKNGKGKVTARRGYLR